MIGRFARCLGAIVTAGTATCRCTVVEVNVRPARREVTVGAVVGCAQVIRRLALREHAIMAGEACALNGRVAEV